MNQIMWCCIFDDIDATFVLASRYGNLLPLMIDLDDRIIFSSYKEDLMGTLRITNLLDLSNANAF